MAANNLSPERAKGKILGMVLMGCELEVATHAAGWTQQEFADECQRDPGFAHNLAHNEGLIELHHMQTVRKAADDTKYWRAAAWWLARKSAERLNRKRVQPLDAGELIRSIEMIIEILWRRVQHEDERILVVADMIALLNEVDQKQVQQIVGEKQFREVFGDAPLPGN